MMGANAYNEGFLSIAGVVMLMIIGFAIIVITRRAGAGGRKYLFGAALIVLCVKLGTNAWLNSSARDCQRKVSADGEYVAELCVLGGERYRGRVYGRANHILLAERAFETSEPELNWSGSDVLFERGGGDASSVTTPPSLRDRLLARIP